MYYNTKYVEMGQNNDIEASNVQFYCMNNIVVL